MAEHRNPFSILNPNRALPALLALTLVIPRTLAAEPEKNKTPTYQSPYSVKFTIPSNELTADFEKEPRNDTHLESSVPFPDWYSPKVRERFGVWGPPTRHYPAPEGLSKRSVEWKRERVIAAALRFQGYGYQHHHVPDWDPPANWPWKETKSGHNGKGVDCSNFTAFAFNFGLGIKFTGAVLKQAELKEVSAPGEKEVIHVDKISKPNSYNDLVKELRTGDLLFIRNKEGEISHVVIWVGSIGQSPDKLPLILDSHGDGVKDSNGDSIPDGVQLRPFRENSWYYKSASHALRIIRAN